MKRVLYVVGMPGSGKSTTLDAAFARLGWKPTMELSKPFAREHISTGLKVRSVSFPSGASFDYKVMAVYLGKHRGGFNGTDALSMGVQPLVLTWLETQREADLVIGEGDRLGNGVFFRTVEDMGYTLDVVLLDTSMENAERRRAERGSAQNETWLKGRVTKTANLIAAFKPYRIDGNGPVETAAAKLAEAIATGVPKGLKASSRNPQ